MYAHDGDEKLQQKFCFKTFAFDNNGAPGGKSLQNFCHGQQLRQKVERRDFSQSRQAAAPTHARRPSPATHTREIPATDERPSQNTLTTRWIACDGPAVQTTDVERESASTIYATEGATEAFLASIESV